MGRLTLRKADGKRASDAHAEAVTLAARGDHARAIKRYRKSLVSEKSATVLNDLGISLMESGDSRAAWEAFQDSMQLAPGEIAPYVNGAVCLLRGGYVRQSSKLSTAALKIDPKCAAAKANLAIALNEMGLVDESIGYMRDAITLDQQNMSNGSSLCMLLNYSPRLTEEEITAEHLAWYGRYSGLLGEPVQEPIRDPDPDRRLRVGYVSADFRRHSVAYFSEPLIAGHNREDYDVYLYHAHMIHDDVTARFRGHAGENWREVFGQHRDVIAKQILDDGIDILVDLGGHSGDARLDVFGRKVAPVQVTMLGYPNTTGMPTMDWRIVDDVTDPAPVSDALCMEKLWRIDGGFLCYRPDDNCPPVAPTPALKNGYITFGSFNNLAKASEPCWRVWGKILASVPDSHLLIKSRVLQDRECVAYVRQVAGACGVSSDRLHIEAPRAGHADHLSVYGQVDIALDTFPYCGTTTTCEAAWMGVPTVTLKGRTHCGRVGASILRDRPELIAASQDEYVAKAIALAGDVEGLQSRRALARGEVWASSLCNSQRYVASVEAAYRAIWKARISE